MYVEGRKFQIPKLYMSKKNQNTYTVTLFNLLKQLSWTLNMLTRRITRLDFTSKVWTLLKFYSQRANGYR